MSKYYKAEDAIRAIEEMQNCYNGWSDTYDKAQIIGVLEELPTIEVSEDCISRADLLKEMLEEFGSTHAHDKTINAIYGMVINAPSVVPTCQKNRQVERAEGEWIIHFDDLFPEESSIECSICHEEQPLGIDDNFCPNCGAKMKGADDE